MNLVCEYVDSKLMVVASLWSASDVGFVVSEIYTLYCSLDFVYAIAFDFLLAIKVSDISGYE